ncbi:MAG: hypothetical protein H0W13_00550 [Nitrospirales bacterium]|nr:hypothetical protein [Nitrospirales bacterium]
MKIRRKLPKPLRSKPPLHVIGFSSSPTLAELRTWFDLEYGGPLSFKDHPIGKEPASSSPLMATHGPWSAWMLLSAPSAQADAWQQRLEWRHTTCAAVGAVTATKSNSADVILHAARLARGITLLTEGTAYDVTMQTYLNPSDWTDRPLSQFSVKDHVTVVHSEDAEGQRDWLYTRGLSKFGLDEIEVFQPIGLPIHTVSENLLDIADELLRIGQSPSVGSTIPIPTRAFSIRVVRHRTHPSADTPLILREIVW